MTPEVRRTRRILLLLLILLAAGLRFWGLGWGLPNAYHVDENWFAGKAVRFIEGDLNPHFFHVGTLHMYMLAGLWKAYYHVGRLDGTFTSTPQFVQAYIDDPTVFYLIGRSLSALFGVGSVLLAFLIGTRLFGTGAGAAAGLFLAVSPEHVKISHAMLPDVPTIFFLLLSFWFVWKVYERGRPRDYVWAGIAAGAAMAMKYAGMMMAVPLFVAHAARVLEHGLPKKKLLLHPPLYLFGAAFLLTFLAGVPYALLDSQRFLIDFKWQSGHLMTEGHFGSSMQQPAWLFYLQYGFRDNLGRWVQYLAYAGLLLAFARRKGREWIYLSYPLVQFALLASWKARATRYLLPAAPFFLLIASPVAAAAAAWLAPRLKTRLRSAVPGPRLAAILAALFTLTAAAPSAVRAVRYDASIAAPDTRSLAKDWIHWNIPEGEPVAIEMYDPPISRQRYDTIYRHSLSELDFGELAAMGVRYAVVSDINYARFTRYPEEFPARAEFYFDLKRESTLLKSFAPSYDEDLLDLHNPTIEVYRLPATGNPRFPGHFERLEVRVEAVKGETGAWTLRARIDGRLGPYVGERPAEPYVRLCDDRGHELVRLVLSQGPIPGGDFRAESSRPIPIPPEGARIHVGYLYDLAPNPLRVPPEQPFFKEAVLPEAVTGTDRPGARTQAVFHYPKPSTGAPAR